MTRVEAPIGSGQNVPGSAQKTVTIFVTIFGAGLHLARAPARF
jgi:hypothetical protein